MVRCARRYASGAATRFDCLVAGWACREEASVRTKHFFILMLCFYAVGTAKYAVQPDYAAFGWLIGGTQNVPLALPGAVVPIETVAVNLPGLDINAWGILPRQTAPAYAGWRVSVTPNIATSALTSLFFFLIALRYKRPLLLSRPALVIALYFTVLSFVRAALSGLALFGLTQFALAKVSFCPLRVMLVAIVLLSVAVVSAVLAPYMLYHLQDFDLVSRLFLRGQSDLSTYDIYRQSYRPWLWGQHLTLFWDSPFLMGQGSSLSDSSGTHILNPGHLRSDSVSFLTRLLATYGLAVLGLCYFLVERCYVHAKNQDIWGVSMLVVIIWLMLTWGSVFHPTNAVFVLSVLIACKGSAAFAQKPVGTVCDQDTASS